MNPELYWMIPISSQAVIQNTFTDITAIRIIMVIIILFSYDGELRWSLNGKYKSVYNKLIENQ